MLILLDIYGVLMLVPLVGFLKFLLVLDPLVGINCTESADVGYLHELSDLNLNSPFELSDSVLRKFQQNNTFASPNKYRRKVMWVYLYYSWILHDFTYPVNPVG